MKEERKLRIAFDIDDALIVPSVANGLDRDTPNYENIAVLKWFQAQGHEIVLWSGSGVDWAQTWGDKLGLLPFRVIQKGSEKPDICFDDCDVELATINIKVRRINNGISRADWNKNKKPTPTSGD